MYNHALKTEEPDRILILFEGAYSEWSTVEKRVERASTDQCIMSGQYSARGLVNVGLDEWKTLEPFLRLPPPEATADPQNLSTGLPPLQQHDWGDRYLLEFCSWIIDKPRLSGDHLWIRLKTPNGQVYSHGQYRESKLSTRTELFPLKTQVSSFQSPDICEFWSGNFNTLACEITVCLNFAKY